MTTAHLVATIVCLAGGVLLGFNVTRILDDRRSRRPSAGYRSLPEQDVRRAVLAAERAAIVRDVQEAADRMLAAREARRAGIARLRAARRRGVVS